MSLVQPSRPNAQPMFARRAAGLLSKIAPDRRRHKRVAVTLLGRFMRENRQEYPCKLIDISVGGAAMMSPVDVAMDERIVAYFDQLGGLEGTVVRQINGGFGLKLIATPHKREKLAAQLTFIINRPHLGDFAERRHERMRPKNATQSLTLVEGLTISCQVIDFSLSGAFIATPARPELGTEIKLGNVRCKVIRHRAEGIAVQFIDVQQPNALRKYFG
jgi:PilZ domain